MQRQDALHVSCGHICNNACLFCVDGGKNERRERQDMAHHVRFMEENKKFDKVVFTCNEPTLYTDLEELVAAAKRMGFSQISVVTNGRQLRAPDYVDRLLLAGLTRVQISFHGATPEIHDQITQRQGSLVQTTAGLREILARREDKSNSLDLIMHSTLNRLNMDHLPELVDLAAAFGADMYGLNAMFMAGRALVNASDVDVSYTELATQLGTQFSACAGIGIMLTEIPPCVSLGRIPMRYLGIREEFHLAPVCPETAEEEFQAFAVGRDFAYGPPCQGCRQRAVCDGVPQEYVELHGWSEFEAVTAEDLQRYFTLDNAPLLALVASDDSTWTVKLDTLEANRALLQVFSASVPEGMALILRRQDSDKPAFRRSRRHALTLRGKDHTPEQMALAEEVFAHIRRREMDDACLVWPTQNGGKGEILKTFERATTDCEARYGVLANHVPELFAIHAGLRTATQLSLDADEAGQAHLARVEAFGARSGLWVGSHQSDGKLDIVIANSRLDLDDENPLFGVPTCCQAAMLSSGAQTSGGVFAGLREVISGAQALDFRISPVLMETPFHLYRHLPCGLNCSSTQAYADKLLQHIGEFDAQMATWIQSFNQRPVFFTDICGQAILFDGEIQNNQVHYRGFFCSANQGTTAPGALPSDDFVNNRLYTRIVAALRLGDRMAATPDGIAVFQGRDLLIKFGKPVELSWRLLSFIDGTV